ncbi:glycerophosphoryl diester phosphodiesterase membrane domain-containing protein [Marininema mesophilum]|uniref:glycerophosphoryl diester phosphodiesterase membrane domain-containing protein n=1 Tax=Marininema mesophilum TaxID=1048340 RepID=UPI00115FE692|nr:glycerophosphoryl diester phosphodiesterase membrane domain-containing protein [Marininema mesophilum]
MNHLFDQGEAVRPQRFYDLLDGVFRLYRQRWKTTWMILFLCLGPPYLVAEVALLRGGGNSDPFSPLNEGGQDWAFLILSIVIYLLIWMIFVPLMQAGVTAITASRIQRNEDLSFKEVLRKTGRVCIPVLFTLLLMGLLITLLWVILGILWAIPFGLLVFALNGWQIPLIIMGFLFFLSATIITIWVSIRLILTLPIVVEEETGYLAAIKRSWRLTKGSFWKIFGASLIVGIVVGFFSMVSGLLSGVASGLYTTMDSGFVWISVLITILNIFFLCLPLPLQPILNTFFYYDCQSRREGTDLERDLVAIGEIQA